MATIDQQSSLKGRGSSKHEKRTAPVIIISGIKTDDVKGSCYDVRRRGFFIEAQTECSQGLLHMAVTMTPKLVSRLAFQCDLNIQPLRHYEWKQQLYFATMASREVANTQSIGAANVWIAHDQLILDQIKSAVGDTQLDLINTYYGTKIAYYFGWLTFYTSNMKIVALCGSALWLQQYRLGDTDSQYVPAFSIFIIVWGSYLLEMWKRKSQELDFHWTALDCQQNQHIIDDFAQGVAATADMSGSGAAMSQAEALRAAEAVGVSGVGAAKPAFANKIPKPIRMLLSFSVVVLIILLTLRLMIFYYDMQMTVQSGYGGAEDQSSWGSYLYCYLPTIMYSIVPIVATLIFEPISERLNAFEGHSSNIEAENSLVIKGFALQFVNRYSALFYTAFYKKDYVLLRSLLITLLTTSAIVNNVAEVGVPMVMGRLAQRKEAAKATKAAEKKKEQQQQQQELDDAAAGRKTEGGSGSGVDAALPARSALSKQHGLSQHQAAIKHGATSLVDLAVQTSDKNKYQAKRDELLSRELSLPEYSLFADYAEMAIQFGYVLMFAGIFPLAGAAAYANNLIEKSVDLMKLSECRRPPIERRDSIGAWQTCLELISFLAVLTNCYIIMMISSHFGSLLSHTWLLGLGSNGSSGSGSGVNPQTAATTTVVAAAAAVSGTSSVGAATANAATAAASAAVDAATTMLRSEDGRWWAMIALEHTLFLLKLALMKIIDDTPQWVRDARAKLALQKQKYDILSMANALRERAEVASGTAGGLVGGNNAALKAAAAKASRKKGIGFVGALGDVGSSTVGLMGSAVHGTTEAVGSVVSGGAHLMLDGGKAVVGVGGSIVKGTGSLVKGTAAMVGFGEKKKDKDKEKEKFEKAGGGGGVDTGSVTSTPAGKIGGTYTTASTATTAPDGTPTGVLFVSSPVPGTPAADAAAAAAAAAGVPAPPLPPPPADQGYTYTAEDLATFARFSAESSAALNKEQQETMAAAKATAERLSRCLAFDPINMVVLIVLPLILHYLQVWQLVYVPLSLLFFGYLQNRKNRIDQLAAVGIVSDPALLSYMLKDIPSWIHDSEYEKLEWLNLTVGRLWPHISRAVNGIVHAKVQPILQSVKPSFLTCLDIQKCSLGLKSPKFTGIRVHTLESESNLRIDLEVRWAGEPDILLKVGTLPLPMHINLDALLFSAVFRVELLEFSPVLPCFKALSVTCMKKPEVSFSLKVASVDAMSLGVGDINPVSLVQNILHSQIENMLVYPKKIIVPMGAAAEGDDSISALNSNKPVGYLELTIEKAVDLKHANLFGGSDPYVVIQSLDQKFTTSAINNNVNPVWNESFQLLIFDKTAQAVQLEVFDADTVTKDTSLGKAVFDLHKVEAGVKVQRQMQLTNTDRGVLHIEFKYVSTSSSAQTEEDSRDNKRNSHRSSSTTHLHRKPLSSRPNTTTTTGDNGTDDTTTNQKDPAALRKEEAFNNDVEFIAEVCALPSYGAALGFHSSAEEDDLDGEELGDLSTETESYGDDSDYDSDDPIVTGLQYYWPQPDPRTLQQQRLHKAPAEEVFSHRELVRFAKLRARRRVVARNKRLAARRARHAKKDSDATLLLKRYNSTGTGGGAEHVPSLDDLGYYSSSTDGAELDDDDDGATADMRTPVAAHTTRGTHQSAAAHKSRGVGPTDHLYASSTAAATAAGGGGGGQQRTLTVDLQPSQVFTMTAPGDSDDDGYDSPTNPKDRLQKSKTRSISPERISSMNNRYSSNGSRGTKSAKNKGGPTTGTLTLSLIHLKNLVGPRRFMGLVDKTFKPYVAVTVGDKTVETIPQRNETHPYYDDVFHFIISDLAEQRLVLRVLDFNKYSKPGKVGKLDILLSDALAGARNGTIEKEYLLPGEGGGPDAFCSFKLQFAGSN